MDLIDLVEETGYTPKRKASCYGGEYKSPCPFCKDGDDRFFIQPHRHNQNGEFQGGRFRCRVCGKHGDAITFLRELYGLSYKEACEKLRIKPKERSGGPVRVEKSNSPPVVSDPSAVWQQKGTAFVKWCHNQLLANPSALSIVRLRGFSSEAMDKFKIGFCPRAFYLEREEWGLEPQLKDDGSFRKHWLPMGITIPTFSIEGTVIKIKIRRTDWKEEDRLPKYVEISGSKQSPSIYGDISLPCGLVLESELDALLVHQFASDLVYCVALGGATKPYDQITEKLLRRTPLVLFCPDFDLAGAKAWVKWKNKFPHIQRIITPDGKGAGDAYLAGVDLREWINQSIGEIKQKVKSNKTEHING